MNVKKQSLGETLFKYRDYTPIPLIILLLIFHNSTVLSATVGLLMIFAGELFRVYSVAFIGSISRTRKGNLGARLITEGPFSFMRNPLYVGNFFITLGIATFGGSIGVIILSILLFTFQYHFIVRYEEGLLFEKFGEEYHQFCQDVPAWIPKKRVILDKIEWPDTFSPAIKSERKTLMTICALVIILTLLS